MFRLYEIEHYDENEVMTRVLSHLHATLDTKFPHSKSKVPDAFKDTAFSIVEDTISDGEPKKELTPGIPETKEAIPITKSSQDLRKKNESPTPVSNVSNTFGENTQFSLDEPSRGSGSEESFGKRSKGKAISSRLFVLLILFAIAYAAFLFLQRDL